MPCDSIRDLQDKAGLMTSHMSGFMKNVFFIQASE